MARSAQAKGRDSVARLQAWLAAGNPVPRQQGKVHRAALCRAVGIVRSTLGSNPTLRALIASLDAEERREVVKVPSPWGVGAVSVLERELAVLRAENADLRRQLRTVELLLRQDRCLR